ncbi:MAG: hypothetical protein IJS74_03600 [Clostridia bacterium]|nr:hypothetical protein [Clostridia bacterium]
MKKFWLFISSILSAILVVVGLSACNPKKVVEDYTITSVKANNLYSTYHTSDTINFSDVTIEVTFKNGTKVTLTQGEVDIEKENAKEGTQFILNTDGLGTQTAGELEEGEYQISVYLSAYATTKQDLMTVTVTEDLSTKYNLYSFLGPQTIAGDDGYEKNIVTSETDESKFYKADGYYVGDDNEFRFKPRLEIGKTEDESFEADNYKVKVTVNGTEIVEGQQYDLFKYENFKFYFKDGTEWTDENNTFTISMLPADFAKNAYGRNITPVIFTVKVADGYNVYDAVDLGRLSLVSDAFKADAVRTTYERWQSGEVFYNPNGGFKRVVYYQLWEDFLTSKGKTNLKPVNAMFIHNDITVTSADIPQEYLISVAEAKAFVGSNNENDYGYLVNSFRDEGWLYPHYMENDFTFNGNMFKLDFSNIKWCLSNSDGSTGDAFYYTQNQSNYFMSHAVLFGFLGKSDNTSAQKAIFKNVESIGNSKNITKKTDQEANEASGSFIYFKSDASEVDVDNCIAKAFMIAFYSEYNKKVYSEGEQPELLANNGLDVSYCKIYDCYNSGLFSYWGENNTLTHSELKRFGGPTIFLINGTEKGAKESSAEWTIDDETIIESEVTGEEAWFAINGATGAALKIINFSSILSEQTDKYFAIDGKINMKAVALESAYLGSTDSILYNFFRIGDSKIALNMGNPTSAEQMQAGTTIYTLVSLSQKDPSTWTQDEVNAYNEAMAFGYDNARNVFIQLIINNILTKSPVFLSDGGTMAHLFPKGEYEENVPIDVDHYSLVFVDIDATIANFLQSNYSLAYKSSTTFEGDLLYIMAPAGSTSLAAVVDLYTKEAQAE